MKSTINKRKIGIKYENLAKNYLEKNNYQIIEQNFYSRLGEIDLIAKNEDYLCFIEVKYRNKDSLVSGVYAVDKHKQNKIYSVAPCRFDVVSIDGEVISLIKNAF